MRPISIELQGFGSYVDPAGIDFTDLSLAAITGPNGAGKSTLFDAMLYALFGSTRAGDADSVINTDVDEARVVFCFELDGARYRVTRIRVRNKRTGLSVEADDAQGGWVALSDGSVRGGDEAIGTLLGATAEILLATTILAQGDAARFADAQPVERKRLLGEILGLERYQVLADAAKTKVAVLKAGIATGEARLDELEVLIDAKLFDEAERDRLVDDVMAADLDLGVAQNAFGEAKAELASVAGRVERVHELEGRIAAARRDHTEARTHAQTELDRARADLKGVRDAVLRAERRVAVTTDAESRMPDEAERLVGLQGRLDGGEARRLAIVEAGQRARSDAELAEAAKTRDREERDALLERDSVLGRGDGACFTCGQALDDHTRAQLVTHTRDELTRLETRIADAEAQIAGANTQRNALRDELKRLDLQLGADRDAMAECQRSIGSLRSIVEDAPEAAAALVEAHETLARAEARVGSAEAALEALGTGPDLTELETALDEARGAIGDHAALAERCAHTEARVRAIGDVIATGRERLGALNAKITAADDAATTHAELNVTLGAQRREVVAAEVCVRAFGRDGVPALILAAVARELDHHANTVLDQLSAGQLAVRIETRRDAKTTKSTTETVEITVITSEGERPYLSFSGSERLRVDIAIRVALARVLANRSGRSVRMLAIDEGWGALDPEGVNALVSTLTTLSAAKEFDTILTITHVPEVAAAFPARVLVERNAMGASTVKVLT